MKKLKSLKQHMSNIFYGHWSWGWEQYAGKPQFDFIYAWHDEHNYALHIRKLWICVEY